WLSSTLNGSLQHICWSFPFRPVWRAFVHGTGLAQRAARRFHVHRIVRWGIGGALLLGAFAAAVAPAHAEETEKQVLQDRLRAVEDELALLRRQFEVKQEDDARDKERSAVVSADGQGFQIRSRDGKSYRLRLRGYVQTDGRFFVDGGDTTAQETFTIRRARPIFEGTLFGYADFRIMPDFGGGSASLQDGYLNLRPWTFAQFQTGKFKSPFGLERLQSGTAL